MRLGSHPRQGPRARWWLLRPCKSAITGELAFLSVFSFPSKANALSDTKNFPYIEDHCLDLESRPCYTFVRLLVLDEREMRT
jgi:hypothetical protein